MDDIKQAGRDIQVETRKKVRDLDGHDLGDDIGNAGDEIRKDLGNAGDEIRRDVDKVGDDLRRHDRPNSPETERVPR